MVPVFVWLFVTNHENVAVLLYCAAAWTDFFDGFLARKMGVVSKLGQLLDPFSDRVLIIALVVALVVRRALPWWLAAVLVARDVLLLAAWPIWEKKGVERIAVNMVGKTATAALFFGLTWLAFDETSFTWAQSGHAIGMPFVIFGAVLYWVAGGIYAQEARHKLASAPAAGSL
jgi:cardiolipin synthase